MAGKQATGHDLVFSIILV